MSRPPFAGLAVCACLLSLPATASAASFTGEVVAPPVTKGASSTIPVLARDGTLRKVVVPARGAIRARSGRLTAGQLRLGDAVRAIGTRKRLTGTRPRATSLRVGQRGTVPSFDALTGSLQQLRTGVQDALTEVSALPQSTDAITALNAAPATTRDKLFAVRATVNDEIAALRTRADALDAAAAAGRGPYVTTLKSDAGSARQAADALDDAVAQLDTTINAVGGASPPALPIGGVSTVTAVLQTVLDIIGKLQV